MGATLYITSTHEFAGKSALCVALLRRFQRDGLTVGYMKPVCTARLLSGQIMDEDVSFMKETFHLKEPMDLLAPVLLTHRQVEAVLDGQEPDFHTRLLDAFAKVSQGKDIVILEGGGSLREGWIVNLAPPQTAALLNARVLEIVPYNEPLQLVDDLITARARLQQHLMGVVVNHVPPPRMDFVERKVRPYARRHQVHIHAILPREQLLLSVSVAELAQGLEGEILGFQEASEELVEHLVVGAMTVDRALTFFRRKMNKAVITGGDRIDIQFAALDTSTRCLILTGANPPHPQVLAHAGQRGVAVIVTRFDTMTAITRIEKFFGKTRFHQEKKIARFEELLERQMDFAEVFRQLGLY